MIKKRILVIGPSVRKSKGGMTSVIQGIVTDKKIQDQFIVDSYPSYIDGNALFRTLYALFSYLRFLFVVNNYDIFHVNVASNGSTFRKALYVKIIKKRKKKVILHVHGGKYIEFYERTSGYKRKIVDNMWNDSDMVIALSNELKDKYKKIFPDAKITVVENGVDTEAFRKAKTDLKKNKYSIAYIGRIVKEKGIIELIDALEKLLLDGYNLKIHIAGDGEVNMLREYAEKKNVLENIIFHGWINTNEEINMLSQCAILILPSYAEALPLCILEAMAAGKAIIASNVGAIPEIIDENTGILIEPKKSNQICEAIKMTILRIESDQFDGERSIQLVEKKYSWHKMHSELCELYNECR